MNDILQLIVLVSFFVLVPLGWNFGDNPRGTRTSMRRFKLALALSACVFVLQMLLLPGVLEYPSLFVLSIASTYGASQFGFTAYDRNRDIFHPVVAVGTFVLCTAVAAKELFY